MNAVLNHSVKAAEDLSLLELTNDMVGKKIAWLRAGLPTYSNEINRCHEFNSRMETESANVDQRNQQLQTRLAELKQSSELDLDEMYRYAFDKS